MAFDLARYLDKLDLDPAELAEISDRLNTIQRMLSKYGDPIEAALAYRAEIGGKIAELEKSTDDFSALGRQLAPLLKELETKGRELTAKRESVAETAGARWLKRSSHSSAWKRPDSPSACHLRSARSPAEILPAAASGFDQVEFIVQTNPGLAAQPLRKIASGGELGRVMLALKGILAQSDRISVLVFDEIDANIGGRLGSVLGSKLRRLAAHHQVLCITHLPQIACYADRHLTVRKEVTGKLTETKVRLMEGADRLHEIAEMIGGQRITDVTRAQAQELLDTAARDSGKSEIRSAKSETNSKLKYQKRSKDPAA